MPAYESTEEYLNSTPTGRQVIRIRENVSAALTAIGAKGVSVPSGSNSDDLADLIGAIQSGGGTPSQTQHTIYFEFSDNTNTTITAYWDGAFISNAVTATKPNEYDGKSVTLAQLDGVTWYSYNPSAIPLNTQLIDFSAFTNGYVVGPDGSLVEQEWHSATDYTEIDPSMTFSYRGNIWLYLGFYDASKNAISTIYIYNDATPDPNNDQVGVGTLTPAKIPANARYVRISTVQGGDASYVSLIRTA